MPQYVYLIISIVLIAFFVVLFFVTFVKNRKTPVPKGCEGIQISEENCSACNNTLCSIKGKFDVEKVKEEIEKDSNEIEEDK